MPKAVRGRLLLAAGAIALLPVTPVVAQEAAVVDPAMEPTMAAVMQGLFPAKPLTAEQEEQLPTALALADQVVPNGIYARMMDEMLPVLMGPMVDLFSSTGMPPAELSVRLGLPANDIAGLTEAERLEITGLLDPAYAERGRVAMTAMMEPIGGMVAAVEPQLRTGIARAYASRFDGAELAAIRSFFATPAGARFAGELLPVFSDPQVMSASMDMLPQIMERMPQMMEAATIAVAALPPERGFADLSNDQRARLARLLGLDVDALKEAMIPAPVMVPVP